MNYADKIKDRKRGIISQNSPFRVTGISKRVCVICKGYFDENGLTGEYWDEEKDGENITHGYCPKHYAAIKKALEEA